MMNTMNALCWRQGFNDEDFGDYYSEEEDEYIEMFDQYDSFDNPVIVHRTKQDD